MVIALALICYVSLVSLLFIFVEDWPFTDSFYFTWVMITTVGYGDLAPKSEFGRVSIIPLFIVGGAIMFMFLSAIDSIFLFYLHKFASKWVARARCGNSTRATVIVELTLSLVALLLWMQIAWPILAYADPKVFLKYEDFIWTSIITFTTVGYGDKTPEKPMARLFWFLYMIPGLSLMAIFLGRLDDFIHIQDLIQSKKKEAKVKKRLKDLDGINTVALERTFSQLEHHVEHALSHEKTD